GDRRIVQPDTPGGGGGAGRRRPPHPRRADHLQRDGAPQGAGHGELWTKRTGLPLPLGVNVTRRDLGEDMARRLSEALRASIRYAHANPDEAVGYALKYGRGIDADTCKRFVHMYVNDYTVALGEEGRRALATLYREAVDARLLDAMPPLDPL